MIINENQQQSINLARVALRKFLAEEPGKQVSALNSKSDAIKPLMDLFGFGNAQ